MAFHKYFPAPFDEPFDIADPHRELMASMERARIVQNFCPPQLIIKPDPPLVPPPEPLPWNVRETYTDKIQRGPALPRSPLRATAVNMLDAREAHVLPASLDLVVSSPWYTSPVSSQPSEAEQRALARKQARETEVQSRSESLYHSVEAVLAENPAISPDVLALYMNNIFARRPEYQSLQEASTDPAKRTRVEIADKLTLATDLSLRSQPSMARDVYEKFEQRLPQLEDSCRQMQLAASKAQNTGCALFGIALFGSFATGTCYLGYSAIKLVSSLV